MNHKLVNDAPTAYTKCNSPLALTFLTFSCAFTLAFAYVTAPIFAIICFCLSALILVLGEHIRSREFNR